MFSGKCYSKARLAGKTAIVTGSNTGIGKETVKDFYKRGGRVIMACRSVQKAAEAKAEIEKACQGLPDTGEIVVEQCDLSALKSVRAFAAKILETEPQINILVNNGGLRHCPYTQTEDGFELQLGTNHLGHFLLSVLLLPRIISSKPARIVTVSSGGHARGKIHFDDINLKKEYEPDYGYSQSKLANVLFTKELAKRLKEHNVEGVNTYSLHPGAVKTELGRNMNKILYHTAAFVMSPILKSPEQGAQTTIYCSVDEKCANETGLYYKDCAVVTPSKKALDMEVAHKLWELSCEMVGVESNQAFVPDHSAY